MYAQSLQNIRPLPRLIVEERLLSIRDQLSRLQRQTREMIIEIEKVKGDCIFEMTFSSIFELENYVKKILLTKGITLLTINTVQERMNNIRNELNILPAAPEIILVQQECAGVRALILHAQEIFDR